MKTLARFAAATLLFAFAIIAAELAYRASAGDRTQLPPSDGEYRSASASETQPRTKPKTYAYSGNTKSKKFHEKSCRHSDCPNCTAKFATRQEAIEAGYSPCGVCDP